MPEEIVVEEKECKACGYALACVGIVVSALFLYMAVDIFSNGRVSALFIRTEAE